MVEKERGPCDYQFENIKCGTRIFRVPVIDNTFSGKVIENSFKTSETKQAGTERQPRSKKPVYTHFLSIPVSTEEIK